MPPFHRVLLLPPYFGHVHLPTPLPSCLLSSLCVSPSSLRGKKYSFSSSSFSSTSSSSICAILSRLGQGTFNPSQAEDALPALQQLQQQKGEKGYDSVDGFANIEDQTCGRLGLDCPRYAGTERGGRVEGGREGGREGKGGGHMPLYELLRSYCPHMTQSNSPEEGRREGEREEGTTAPSLGM